MSRGNRQKDIYQDDVDRQDFLKTLAEACQKTGFQIHAYLAAAGHRTAWMRVDRLLGEHGMAKDTANGQRELERRMERCRHKDADGTEGKRDP